MSAFGRPNAAYSIWANLGAAANLFLLIKTDPHYDANTFHEKKIRSLHPILLLLTYALTQSPHDACRERLFQSIPISEQI